MDELGVLLRRLAKLELESVEREIETRVQRAVAEARAEVEAAPVNGAPEPPPPRLVRSKMTAKEKSDYIQGAHQSGLRRVAVEVTAGGGDVQGASPGSRGPASPDRRAARGRGRGRGRARPDGRGLRHRSARSASPGTAQRSAALVGHQIGSSPPRRCPLAPTLRGKGPAELTDTVVTVAVSPTGTRAVLVSAIGTVSSRRKSSFGAPLSRWKI